jgi:hypothetical protein
MSNEELQKRYIDLSIALKSELGSSERDLLNSLLKVHKELVEKRLI